MPRTLTDFGKRFREKFGYTGKLTKERMGKELWNEYFKMKSKEHNASLEHKKELAERKEERRKRHIATLKHRKETGAYLSTYCNDDYTKIENYEKAKADGFKGWLCHHRLETHTSDGERRTVDITVRELIALEMYYKRPAEELILMKVGDHRRLHQCGKPSQRNRKYF